MARARMVTRAIIGTQVKALCFDADKNNCVEVETLIAGVFKNEEKLVKKLHTVLDTDKQTFVKVISATQKSTLYGMSEDKFIKNAVELDPATRRIFVKLETEDETEVDNQ